MADDLPARLTQPDRKPLLDERGVWYCDGEDGCGAFLQNWVKHEFWHQDGEARLIKLLRSLGAPNGIEVR